MAATSTTTYYTGSGPRRGPFLWRDAWGTSVVVLQSRDDRVPIGLATPIGVGAGGVATWRLVVRGSDVPGRWIVVGGEFWPEG
jgi:hypothetical protein